MFPEGFCVRMRKLASVCVNYVITWAGLVQLLHNDTQYRRRKKRRNPLWLAVMAQAKKSTLMTPDPYHTPGYI